MAADDGVSIITPDGHEMSFGTVLPGHVLQFGSDDLSHKKYLTILKLCFARIISCSQEGSMDISMDPA